MAEGAAAVAMSRLRDANPPPEDGGVPPADTQLVFDQLVVHEEAAAVLTSLHVQHASHLSALDSEDVEKLLPFLPNKAISVRFLHCGSCAFTRHRWPSGC